MRSGNSTPFRSTSCSKFWKTGKCLWRAPITTARIRTSPGISTRSFKKGCRQISASSGPLPACPTNCPPAIRSRCLEIFFRGLRPAEIGVVAANAVRRINFQITEEALEVVKRYAVNGREAVNMIQLAAGIAQNEKRRTLTREDIEWVVNSTQHNPRPEIKPPAKPQVGYVNGLAVYGPNMGTLIEVEATTMPVRPGQGKVSITGIIEGGGDGPGGPYHPAPRRRQGCGGECDYRLEPPDENQLERL